MDISPSQFFAMKPILLVFIAIAQALDVSSSYWYANVDHNGISPSIKNGTNWTVFRNVKDFGAKADGIADDTAAIQKAIDTGDGTSSRATGRTFGMTGQPAVIYFPPGTYSIKKTISNRVGTILMGDPINRPVIKATPDFKGNYLLVGHDTRYMGLIAFYHGIKNLVLDSTAISTATITILDWGVSQANQLSNIMFRMPVGAMGHTAIATPGTCTQLLYNDLQIIGGGVGISLSVTQVHLKNIYFKGIAIFVKPEKF
jgi:glucan 1,3-beta-glucosidase